MQEAQKRDSEAAELAAKMEKEKKEMQASANFFHGPPAHFLMCPLAESLLLDH